MVEVVLYLRLIGLRCGLVLVGPGRGQRWQK